MPTNPVLEQIPVRLKCVVVSYPPGQPIDQNTGLTPKAWRATGMAVQVGIFDNANLGVDLTNLTYLDVVIQDSQNALQTLVSKRVLAANITPIITIADFLAGLAQNATAVFTAADLDLGLDANTLKDYWLQIRGFTASGAPIVYAAGPVTLYNPGFPAQPTTVVSLHKQTSNVGDITVTPTSQLHKEDITINGAARTVNCILGNIGSIDGAELTVMVTLPATAGITINFKTALSTNPVLSTITTGSVLRALLKYYYDATLATWVAEMYLLPPT